ncbi:MAG: cyclomaltodextrinase N-terminal domain-containing protein, partial [Gammaproteobacteria bacterium]|nr:cyclomaltodextrinase N-terminal domain-containing protein [Gammaproteobacteria bacterium]
MRNPVLFLSLLLMSIDIGAQVVERVEPPFWWQGFVESELQLLVYGDAIGLAVAHIDHPAITLKRSTTVENPNYLFLYLEISNDATPGEFEITFTRGDEQVAYDYRLLEKNTQDGYTLGYDNHDAIYLVTPDRFANGDPGNDDIEAMGDPVNRDGWQDRHGGDIAGMQAHLDY